MKWKLLTMDSDYDFGDSDKYEVVVARIKNGRHVGDVWRLPSSWSAQSAIIIGYTHYIVVEKLEEQK